jgi:hypothetical protein
MKLWLFQFTDSSCPMESARVVADDRPLACAAMQLLLSQVGSEVSLDGARPRPAEGVLLSLLGLQTTIAGPVVQSCKMRDGSVVANPEAR